MAKKKLADFEMNDAAVHELRIEHQELLQRHEGCRGNVERAMYSLQEGFGLNYWSQWNFQYKRYRKPPMEFLFQLRQVILLVTSKSVQKDIAKLDIEAAKGNVAPDLEGLRAEAKALAAKIEAATRKVA